MFSNQEEKEKVEEELLANRFGETGGLSEDFWCYYIPYVNYKNHFPFIQGGQPKKFT